MIHGDEWLLAAKKDEVNDEDIPCFNYLYFNGLPERERVSERVRERERKRESTGIHTRDPGWLDGAHGRFSPLIRRVYVTRG